MRLNIRWIASLATIAAAATASHAAMWTQPSGSTANFTYSNGHDTNGLFGNPTVTATGFSFTPENFIATSVNGSTANALTNDYLTVDVAAKPGSGGIRGVNFGESGDYSIFNGGGVFVQAYVIVQDLDTGASFKKLLVPTPAMPVTGGPGMAASGEWTGTLSIDFGGRSANRIRIALNNILQAYSNPGGTALIQKKLVADPDGTGPGIEIISGNTNVPEPATLAALGCVAVIAIRRKR